MNSVSPINNPSSLRVVTDAGSLGGKITGLICLANDEEISGYKTSWISIILAIRS